MKGRVYDWRFRRDSSQPEWAPCYTAERRVLCDGVGELRPSPEAAGRGREWSAALGEEGRDRLNGLAGPEEGTADVRSD